MNKNEIFITRTSPLPSECVSGGDVTKNLVYRENDTEVSILELSPGAEIVMHQHTEDSEIYFLIGSDSGEICQLGSSHQFRNLTSSTVHLLSIKTKKKMRKVKEDGMFFARGI